MPTQTYTSTDFTYSSTDIEEVSSKLQLKLSDDPGQQATEDFADDTDFTYDNTKAEFSGGVVQQKDMRPTGATLYASCNTDEDNDWDTGATNNTLSGGATWDSGNGGQIDLTGRSGKRWNVPGSGGNFDTVGSAGCIRFTYIPDYSGIPAAVNGILEYDAVTGNNNAIFITHNTASHLVIDLRDSVGAAHNLYAYNLNWLVAGTQYVFELNFDFNGTSRIFIDGTQYGSLNTSSWTRVGESGTFKWGGASGTGDFYIQDLILFDSVQHTSNHTGEIPYTYSNYVYVESQVDLPRFNYVGPGAVQLLTDFTTTETGSVRYSFNDLYWDGAAWSATSDTYATASSKADILANLATFPHNGTYTDISLYFTESNSTQSNVDELMLECTTQIYPTTNPNAETTTGFDNEGIESFTAVSSATGSDAIKYTLSKDGTDYYWSNEWTTSNGTYAQSNTASEISDRLSTWGDTKNTTKVKVYFHSNDGTTTPNFTSIEIDYDFWQGSATAPTTCIVYGTVYDNEGNAAEGVAITAYLSKPQLEYDSVLLHNATVTANTDSDGQFEIELVETSNLNAMYHIKFDYGTYEKEYDINVPNQASVDISTLI